MKKPYFGGCILVASAIVASTASADTYSDCEIAFTNGDTARVERLAAQILGFNSVPAHKRQLAEICVSAAKGESLVYSADARAFVSPAAAEAVRTRICELQDVVTETRETIRQAEAAQQDRRIETLAVTIQECSAWFEDDARAALTNDVCNSIFASGGLPNSEIAGPTTSEVLLAEVINTNASTELEILVESGMLLETIKAMAAEMGIPESGDAYDCDQ